MTSSDPNHENALQLVYTILGVHDSAVTIISEIIQLPINIIIIISHTMRDVSSKLALEFPLLQLTKTYNLPIWQPHQPAFKNLHRTKKRPTPIHNRTHHSH